MRNPLDKLALNTPEVRFMFWVVRPLHLFVVRTFLKEINKIPSDDHKVEALLHSSMISIKHPLLEMMVFMVPTLIGGAIGAGGGAALIGYGMIGLGCGGFLGMLPGYSLWTIRGLIQSRKFERACLEDLGYQQCPTCGWYFNEEVDCRCIENQTNGGLKMTQEEGER